MSELRVLGREGDVKTIWDKDNEDEVAAARKTFNEMRAKGYSAWSVKADGEKDRVITEFDPKAEKIILAPAIRGG